MSNLPYLPLHIEIIPKTYQMAGFGGARVPHQPDFARGLGTKYLREA